VARKRSPSCAPDAKIFKFGLKELRDLRQAGDLGLDVTETVGRVDVADGCKCGAHIVYSFVADAP
jgi:hypothetical protein